MPLDVARRGTLDVRDPPLKAIVDVNDNYEAGYHKGNAGGLDAIDTDLATANIKNGITIFGKVGTFAGGPLAEDLVSDVTGSTGTFYANWITKGSRRLTMAASGDVDVVSDTQTFAATSRAVCSASFHTQSDVADKVKVQIYMGGVQVAESGFVATISPFSWIVMVATRALAGSQIVKIGAHNYDAGATHYLWTGTIGNVDTDPHNIPCVAIMTGSIKI